MLYTLPFFSSSKYSLFHNSNIFGSCIIHILYTGCAKIKKKYNSGAKRLTRVFLEAISASTRLLLMRITALLEQLKFNVLYSHLPKI